MSQQPSEFDKLFTSRGFVPPPWSGVGKGWFKILERMLDHMKLAGADPGCFAQVKEKFGELRVYATYSGTEAQREEQMRAALTAEKESTTTCERCGAPGELRRRFWMKTLCDACDAYDSNME